MRAGIFVQLTAQSVFSGMMEFPVCEESDQDFLDNVDLKRQSLFRDVRDKGRKEERGIFAFK